VFFLKRGDQDAMDGVFWCRVGTSGGVGLPVGTVVVTSEGLMADLKPFRLLNGGAGEYWFDGHFPAETSQSIIAANEYADFDIISGKTIAGNEFFLEQFRLDGAICLETPETKMRQRQRQQRQSCGGEVIDTRARRQLNTVGSYPCTG